MFERYTERARQVVILAQDEARALKHNFIGTEHLLLGLLREQEGLACRVLESLDVTADDVRGRVVEIAGQGDEITTGQIPFTPRAKKVFEMSLREALSLGHNWIGTEHVLLGLIREKEGVAARILFDLDLDAERIRNELIRMLSSTKQVSKEQTREGTRTNPIRDLVTEHAGLLKADSKHKKKIYRLERALVDLMDKNGRLKYELRRLEDALVDCYFDSDNAKHIVPRVIPKRIFKETQDPGKKPKKERKRKKNA